MGQITIDYGQLEAQLDIERRKVDVSTHNFAARELVRMLGDGELSITPEYQRKYRWSDEVASSFIESIFLGLPVPPIFVATNEGFQWEVVDGLQRISSLVYFMADSAEELSAVSKPSNLELKGLTKLSQLNGTTFSELPTSLKRYFGRQPLQIISLTDKSVDEVRFDLFERLNAGAIKLSGQEVRACIYRGDFNKFIERLALYEPFANLLKLQEANKSDATNVEQVLKYFAYKDALGTFSGAVTKFLNSYMKAATDNFDFKRQEMLFTESADILSRACAGGLFKRATTNITPLVQFEACLVGIGQLLESGVTPILPSGDWIEDHELVDSSTGGSNTSGKLLRRVNRAKELFSGK
jgi:hypothetical protein